MRSILLAVVITTLATTFSLTVNQSRSGITLRYPTGVEWVEVCVEQQGKLVYEQNCWTPQIGVEDFKLREGVTRVQAHLTILKDGLFFTTLHTPVIQVKPEED